MLLSDISVKRPVFALVLSALLVAFGILSFDRLPLREYPDIQSPIVSVSTNYPGASASVVENRITEVIEDRLAGLQGVKVMESSSFDGRSNIRLEFKLNRDIDDAANDVRDRVSGILNNIPQEAEPPEVRKEEDSEDVVFWAHLVAPDLSQLELTDYARRYLEDRFSVLDGVARVRVSGGSIYAMRVWVDAEQLVARNLTVADIENAIRSQNVELPAGTLNSLSRDFIIRIERSYLTDADFRQLVLRRAEDGYLVRLGDVARVELGSAEERRFFRGNGESMVGLGIIKQSTANALLVSQQVQAEVGRINADLPEGMKLIASYDDSMFVEQAIDEVYFTLLVAAILVVAVIFIFLGDWRSLLVPALTVPISLIASFSALLILGYSINLLTLLALVLAIGLVVDDSIVVLENIHRRLTRGETPLVASYRGTRQVGFAVIATTLVLMAVFVPITFLQGDVGRLFSEFAVTMAIAVGFSSFVALTLGPVIASKILKTSESDSPMVQRVDRLSDALERRYQKSLKKLITDKLWASAVLVISVLAVWALYQSVEQEYAPAQDRGLLYLRVTTPEGSSFDYTKGILDQVEQRLMPLVDNGDVKRLLVRAPAWGGGDAFNNGFALMVLADFDSDRRDTDIILADARQRVADIAGASIWLSGPRALGGGNSSPVNLAIGGNSFEELAQWQEILLQRLADNPGLINANTNLKPTKPQLRLTIDRNRAGDLGVNIRDVGRTLETMMGGRRVTTFLMNGREYDVLVEAEEGRRRTLSDLDGLYVRSQESGQLVALSNIVTVVERADAGSLNRHNRVRAFTLTADLAEGYSLGEALEDIRATIRSELPDHASIAYKGESLDYQTAGYDVVFTFALALLIVYLVMAAQFESFLHPAVILMTVPLALMGGLGGLVLFDQTLNIYSQVGMIMLVGLATKNGILLVEFINQLRDEGVPFDDAVIQGASRRLRPIIMTALTTVIGAVPLVVSSGPGHESRTVIGIVIMCGVTLATLITLYVIPAVYAKLARNSGSPNAVSRQLEQELQRLPLE
jgi:multidrug efflux pump